MAVSYSARETAVSDGTVAGQYHAPISGPTPFGEYLYWLSVDVLFMERIRGDRKDVIIHGEATIEDLPVEGLPELPTIGGMEPFIPGSLEEPQLYPGDVVVGVTDEVVSFIDLIYDTIDEGVVVISLETGRYELITEEEFASRFFRPDETHIYDGVTDEVVSWDVTIDAAQIERPETGRPR